MILGSFHNSNTTLSKLRQSRCFCIFYCNVKTKVVPSVNLFFKKPVQATSQTFCRVKTRYSLIIRSKKTFTLSVNNLPNISNKPQNYTLYKGPEWDSTVGKAVRLAQLKYPECVILTRVGSFWELYFEQATQVAPLLDIKLTKKKFGQEYMPFAGFPLQHLDRYLTTLVNDHGLAVAICEEFLNDNNDEKIKFKRRVTRVITPGTLIDESFLQQDQNNFLLALSLDEKTNYVGLAWTDITTGQFFMAMSGLESLFNNLARIRPSEIVLNEQFKVQKNHPIWLQLNREKYAFAYESAESFDAIIPQPLQSNLQYKDGNEEVFSGVELQASAALHNYISKNLIERFPKIQLPIRINPDDTMIIDETALRSLEIMTSIRNNSKTGSLIHAIGRTKTKSGTRALDQWLRFPTTSLSKINNRLDIVEYFYRNTHLTGDIRQILQEVDDAQRTSQKISFDYCGPDDFLKLKRTFEAMGIIKTRLRKELKIAPNLSLKALVERLQPQDDLIQIISEAVDEDALVRDKEMTIKSGLTMNDINLEIESMDSVTEFSNNENKSVELDNEEKKISTKNSIKKKRKNRKKDGDKKFVDINSEVQDLIRADNWIIKKSFSDEIMSLHNQLETQYFDMIELQKRWRTELKSPSLELRSHPSFGFIVAVKRKNDCNLEQVLNATRIQHFKSKKWFIVQAWTHLGGKIEEIKSKIRETELSSFQIIRNKISDNWDLTIRNTNVIDEIDIASSLAVLAREQNFVRPIMNHSNIHKIVGGRHPIVESGLQTKERQFVKNDCDVGDKERVLLLTGPNMGGKSTFLRQNAIISILAQIGSFVPADYAEIGIVDQVFSRVGASDNLYRDQSTFMIEMIETANILKNATPRSFVIMDEIGRGTTTLDGIAISYATLYQLHYVKKCRTLFATHFHELANMTKHFEYVACYCTDSQENEDGSFYYLHKVKKGVNRNSAAIRAAQLAGV
ncbi:muts domain V-domain-containing protein [Glomus cerebriforme]|uniref:Muts domain V-domain-containing protein n=1 Tax=Glomus cerebriforme TaxID=658196 RepID=A0A397TL64_9GLOM|nr:muts domain V-domain-containing protein [Glomus cerebriforme]